MSGPEWQPEIEDCRNLFPPLTQLTRFFYVGGNGQEAMPGAPRPEMLRVGVMNGLMPVEGVAVEFETLSPGGQVAEDPVDLGTSTTTVSVDTDSDGVASCAWLPDPDVSAPSQIVTATLLDAASDPTVHPKIYFNGNLSIASEVYYDSSGCLNPNDPANVQDALDQLCENYSLDHVSGDGQEAGPGQPVPQPLIVRVSNGRWPAEADVTFRVTVGSGQVDDSGGPQAEVTVASDPATGLASCAWTLDVVTPSQRVEAFLTGMDDHLVGFNAALRTAGSIAFDPENCDKFDTTVTDVQTAIDELCNMGLGEEPGVLITDVLEAGTDSPVLNDATLPVTSFANGIRIKCDRDPAAASVADKPVCFVTLDMPYPANEADRTLWDVSGVLGYQPLKLRADVSSSDAIVTWKPVGLTRDWLVDKLFPTMTHLKMGDRVLAHLTIKGNFVWASDDSTMYLDGDSYGALDGTRTRLRYPSGNGLKGGDFEMWFWLVQGEKSRPPTGTVVEVATTTTASALIANDDAVTIAAGQSITIEVLANDSGGTAPLKVSAIVTQPSRGTVEIIGDTFAQYTPGANFTSGADSFRYEVQDAAGSTAQANVTITMDEPVVLTDTTDVGPAVIGLDVGDLDLGGPGDISG